MIRKLFFGTCFPPPRFISMPMRVIITGWLLIGLADILSLILNVDINPAYAEGYLAEFVLGVLLIMGSGLVLSSCLPWRREDWAWACELIGWPVLVSAWSLYAIYSYYGVPWLVEIIFGLTFAVTSLWRFLEVIYLAKRTRRILDDLPDDLGGS